MLHQYFQPKNVNPFADSLERPIKELMDLNMRTLQSFSYFTPTEMLKMRKPEEMMEKNLEIMIENSQAAMTYMQNMFGLMEKHLLKNIDSTLKGTKDLSHTIKSTSSAVSAHSKTTAKKTASAIKSVATKAKAKVQSTASKSKSKTGATQLAHSATKRSSVKKQPVKHTGASTSKSGLKTAAPKTTTTTSGMKPANSSMPQRFSSTSSTSSMKPMMKELDTHINKTKI